MVQLCKAITVPMAQGEDAAARDPGLNALLAQGWTIAHTLDKVVEDDDGVVASFLVFFCAAPGVASPQTAAVLARLEEAAAPFDGARHALDRLSTGVDQLRRVVLFFAMPLALAAALTVAFS